MQRLLFGLRGKETERDGPDEKTGHGMAFRQRDDFYQRGKRGHNCLDAGVRCPPQRGGGENCRAEQNLPAPGKKLGDWPHLGESKTTVEALPGKKEKEKKGGRSKLYQIP